MHRPSLFRRLVSGALVASSMVLSPFGTLSARASSPIVIGEVAWAGSSLSTADEWLELWNLGDVDVPIGGDTLIGASINPITLPPDAVIPAHGTYLVANYDASNTKSVLTTTPQHVTTDIALSNSALQIVLQDPNGVEIDRAGTGGTPPAGQSGTTKNSMIRNGETWITATMSSGMKDGSLDLGTPGFCDGCVIETEPSAEPPLLDLGPLPVVATSTPEVPIEQPNTTTTEIIDDATSSSTSNVGTTSTENTTSTEADLPTNVEISTSTETAPLFEIETTSTEQIAEPAVETTSSVATGTQETLTEATEPPRYDLLRLNEIEPNPTDGSEWIEIASVEPAIPVAIAGIQLFDAVGHVLTVATGTIDAQTPFIRIALTSSRLNNSGDSVMIKDPNNGVLDAYVYGETANGVAWARSPDATGEWAKTTTPTPNAVNNVPAPMPISPVATVTTEISTPSPVAIPTTTPSAAALVIPVVKTTSSMAVPVKKTTTLPKTKATPTTVATKKPNVTTLAATSTNQTQKPKATTAKNTSKKASMPKSNTYKPLTFDMINPEIDRGIRVSLHGVVGSPSGLLTSHGFILLSPDGRGLLVRVPTSRKLPAFGETLIVSGTLQFDDLGIPSIKLNSSDGWSTAKIAIPNVTPRDADLFTPSAEDAWSLISVSGTVLAIKNTTVTIMVDGADVNIAIRKIVGYRASRLAIGDTIHATGLLNTSTDIPRIFPRTANEITLVSHAEKKQTAAASAIPGWTPFGAAGLAVAGTEGAKLWRERRKRRTLEKVLQKDIHATV